MNHAHITVVRLNNERIKDQSNACIYEITSPYTSGGELVSALKVFQKNVDDGIEIRDRHQKNSRLSIASNQMHSGIESPVEKHDNEEKDRRNEQTDRTTEQDDTIDNEIP